MDSVNMDNMVVSQKPKKNKLSSSRKKKLIFFSLMTLPFLVQAAIFYIYLNGSTFIMAFLKYRLTDSGDVSTFVWFENFVEVIKRIFHPDRVGMIYGSLAMYAFILLVVTPVVIFFSFYIYKKFFLSGFFRVILFMPQIISSVVYVSLYKFMFTQLSNELFGVELLDPNANPVQFISMIILYVFWTGFGTNILLMSGAMAGIDESVVEACYLDGCNMTREFVHVTLPSIYPTITTFVILDITTIFTNTMNLHLFFGTNWSLPVSSVGYYMEINMISSSGLYPPEGRENPADREFLLYPEIAALGLMITLLISPICIFVRKFMERVGPSED